jgi:HEAT repeat protein
MNIEAVRENLKSTDTEKNLVALKVMEKEGTLSDLQAVIALIKTQNAAVQKAAIAAASDIIRTNLIAHFNELENETRKKLGALMESLDPSIIIELSKDIYCDEEERRLRAVQILGLLKKNPKVRDVLAELVKDRDVKIRATAISLLSKFVEPHEQIIILSLLKDDDKRVRANTVEALEGLGNKRLVPILMRFRKDPSNRIRGNVLKALKTVGNVDISSDLMDMLTSHDHFMQATALWVITQTKAITDALEDEAGHALISENPMVIDNAKKALTVIGSARAKGYMHYLS